MKIRQKSGRHGPARMFEFSTEVEKEMISFERYRPRSSRKCVMKVPAAVGQNLSTAVRRTVYDYDVCQEVLYRYEPSISIDGLRSPVQEQACRLCVAS
ncbi:hypothetical protein E3N88_37382 [Mikania micrantha]|uniref:Uncharacterized protein n=1 Tax=Mikania micrantha TaxID=192012 RepID=A0A5N6LQZ7_9ASTR|nr:hypothetical protein E3N88_37380 [Mikania micrantha]KAD2804004.1 hypothetical protein E3N88_37381 [Mikania micrantha]KAD2804005.1 hypothetical protein E3N88_37382 [Mikania micrantha]